MCRQLRKKFGILLLVGSFVLPLGIVWPGGQAGAAPVATMPNVSQAMLKADYWIDKLEAPEQVVMSPAEIKAFNRQTQQELAAYMVDLKAMPLAYSRAVLEKAIDIPFPKAPSYIDGKPVKDDYWAALRQQLNLSGLQGSNVFTYGIVTQRTNLKIYPTADIVSDAPDDLAFDRFQDSALLVNEPVVIMHRSKDQAWLYIRMYFCSGWVKAEDVAVCPDRAAWLDWQAQEELLVVTGNKFKLEANPFTPQLSGLELSMGTLLPLAQTEEIPSSLDGRALYDNYIVRVPVRDGQGKCISQLAMIPVSKDVSIGYLPYTRGNVLRQAFKLAGDRYGWGGMLDARDCSALVLELYRCFGFHLPRNSSPQGKPPGQVTELTGKGMGERQAVLDQTSPGATLHFPGHVMLYLGKDQGRYYVISALGSFAEFPIGGQGAKLVRTRSVMVNDLTVRRASGLQWLEALTVVKVWEK